MTTAHRPTFDPAKGKSSQSTGTILHARLLPAHSKLKYRQRGQGGTAGYQESEILEDKKMTDREILKARLLEGEFESNEKRGRDVGMGKPYEPENGDGDDQEPSFKKQKLLQVNPEDADSEEEEEEEDGNGHKIDSPRIKSNQENDDNESEDEEDDNGSEEDSDSDDDSEDEAEELRRELQKIEQERAERLEREQAARRELELEQSNPLLAGSSNEQSSSSSVNHHQKSRWYDDSVFQNQAKGIPVRPEDEALGRGFINDALRSDFHRKFMSKYIR